MAMTTTPGASVSTPASEELPRFTVTPTSGTNNLASKKMLRCVSVACPIWHENTLNRHSNRQTASPGSIKKKFPDDKILSVVGGLHLKSASPDVLAQAIAYTDTVKAKGFTFYGGHCTGAKAIACFQEAYGPQAVKPLGAGRVIHY